MNRELLIDSTTGRRVSKDCTRKIVKWSPTKYKQNTINITFNLTRLQTRFQPEYCKLNLLHSLSYSRFVCSKEENWKFLGRNLLFWCRKINLDRDRITTNEIITLRVSTHSATENKPSLSSALIPKFLVLTRAGQCGYPRIFAQIKSPGEKDILRLSKSKGLEAVKEYMPQKGLSQVQSNALHVKYKLEMHM